MYTGLHVKYPLFLLDFNVTENSQQSFEKYSNIKFHENPFSGRRIVPCGWTDGQIERTDRHDHAHSRFSQIWERAKKKRNSNPNVTIISTSHTH